MHHAIMTVSFVSAINLLPRELHTLRRWLILYGASVQV